MSLRTAFARSLRAPRSSVVAPVNLASRRTFIKPTGAVLSAEDEEKSRAAYERHRRHVDPKYATVDESIQWEEPKVRCPTTMSLVVGDCLDGPLSRPITCLCPDFIPTSSSFHTTLFESRH